MATHSRRRSFQWSLFLSVGGVFLLFALCFSVYQYRRECQYKTDILDARLRAYTYEMVQALGHDSLLVPDVFMRYMGAHGMEGLRVTVIDTTGNVLLDSSEPSSAVHENHLRRKEVAEALRTGTGNDIKRVSASTHLTYFYSATRFGDVVVRAAAPYSTELSRSLRADNKFLYFALTLTVLLGLVLYLNTSRVGKHVAFLREFARKAEGGEALDHELERQLPDDELGDISHTITTLFWKLRHSEEDKTRLKRQLTQNAAHELKTPAASIQGFLESIIEHPDMAPERKEHFLRRCYAQSQRMSRLLQDMATLTRLDESAPATLPRESVNVAEVVRAALADVALQLRERGIATRVCMPESVTVTGDRALLYSVFRNVVDNTIAYAAGADLFSVTCAECVDEGARGSDYYYEFTLSDNGQGVDARHLPHLFERFYRVDKGRSREAGGTGLGLAIVKNAVAAHGGTVSAHTTHGGGLTIRLTLSRSAGMADNVTEA